MKRSENETMNAMAKAASISTTGETNTVNTEKQTKNRKEG